jgi:hypothetical protein
MDINKVFPKPRAVEEEMRKRKEAEERQAEIDEIARVRALAPQVAPPTMSQLIDAQIGGHSVDLPVKNPFLTDKLINDELNPMLDMQVNEKRKGWEKLEIISGVK